MQTPTKINLITVTITQQTNGFSTGLHFFVVYRCLFCSQKQCFLSHAKAHLR